MNSDALAEFRRLSRELRLLGLLTPADAGAVTLTAVTWANWLRARRLIDTLTDADFADATGRRLRTICSDSATLLLRLWESLGLNPQSRSRLRLPVPRGADELAAFVEGQGGERA